MPYDSSRRQDAAQRNRTAILTAFGVLLSGAGYRATTIRAVAEHAGVSAELVYKTFGGKPGLLKALWDVTLAGDDEPVAMGERAQLREVRATGDPAAKLHLWAGFVRGVHERLAALHAVLVQAGPEAAQVLAASERERLTGVGAFVGHLAQEGLLRGEADRAVDACWVLTGAEIYTRFTVDRGWGGEAYQQWLGETLASLLLPHGR